MMETTSSFKSKLNLNSPNYNGQKIVHVFALSTTSAETSILSASLFNRNNQRTLDPNQIANRKGAIFSCEFGVVCESGTITTHDESEHWMRYKVDGKNTSPVIIQSTEEHLQKIKNTNLDSYFDLRKGPPMMTVSQAACIALFHRIEDDLERIRGRRDYAQPFRRPIPGTSYASYHPCAIFTKNSFAYQVRKFF